MLSHCLESQSPRIGNYILSVYHQLTDRSASSIKILLSGKHAIIKKNRHKRSLSQDQLLRITLDKIIS